MFCCNIFRVQRGSVGSSLACCKAGPSYNLGGSEPNVEVPPTEPTAVKKWK